MRSPIFFWILGHPTLGAAQEGGQLRSYTVQERIFDVLHKYLRSALESVCLESFV